MMHKLSTFFDYYHIVRSSFRAQRSREIYFEIDLSTPLRSSRDDDS